MSEIERTEQRKICLRFTARAYRSDFDTKTEKKIYDFFAQHARYSNQISSKDILNDLYGLNTGTSNNIVVSDEDINNFLIKCQQGNYKINGKQVKTKRLKNVTVDDIKKFLIKFVNLNPTELELKRRSCIKKVQS